MTVQTEIKKYIGQVPIQKLEYITIQRQSLKHEINYGNVKNLRKQTSNV